MIVYEKNNKLNINFENSLENPDIEFGKSEIKVDGNNIVSGGGGIQLYGPYAGYPASGEKIATNSGKYCTIEVFQDLNGNSVQLPAESGFTFLVGFFWGGWSNTGDISITRAYSPIFFEDNQEWDSGMISCWNNSGTDVNVDSLAVRFLSTVEFPPAQG